MGYADPERRRAYYRARRKANPEKIRAYNRQYRRNNLLRCQEIEQKSRLKVAVNRKVLFADQGFRCAACPATTPGSKKGWHLDHNHQTGKVRGILCHHCNVSLGMAKDSIPRLQGLIDYLLRTDH